MAPEVLRYDGTRYDFVVQFLKEQIKSPALIADVGAGDSLVRRSCTDSHLGFVEFDLAPKSAAVVKWDVEAPCPSNVEADVVVLMDVIEHLWNPGIAMRNIAKIHREGGLLLLSTPNPSWSRIRAQALFRHQISCFTTRDLQSNHHVFTPRHHIVTALLELNGYRLEQIVTLESRTPFPPIRPIITFPGRVALNLVARAIEVSNPMAYGINYLVVARKAKHALGSGAEGSMG
jgi:hypothetical protein